MTKLRYYHLVKKLIKYGYKMEMDVFGHEKFSKVFELGEDGYTLSFNTSTYCYNDSVYMVMEFYDNELLRREQVEIQNTNVQRYEKIAEELFRFWCKLEIEE